MPAEQKKEEATKWLTLKHTNNVEKKFVRKTFMFFTF